jgi:hypothetical protein
MFDRYCLTYKYLDLHNITRPYYYTVIIHRRSNVILTLISKYIPTHTSLRPPSYPVILACT